MEAAKGAVEGQAGRLTLEAGRLHRRAQELENEVAKLNRIVDEAKLQESKQGDRAGRLEVRGVQMHEEWSVTELLPFNYMTGLVLHCHRIILPYTSALYATMSA